MNDRFKFRAWDKETNSFLIHNEEDKTIDLNVFNSVLKRPEKYVVLQCTGIKDKNGTLIYEGDIIQIQGCTEKAKVEYNLEKGMFLLVGKKYAPSAFMTIRKDYWEVIGNIYENADLLQECE